MTTKFIAMLVGLAAVASIGGAFALVQTSQPVSAMHSDGMKTMGHVELTVFGPDGGIKAYRQTDNLVVNNGDNSTVNKMFGVSRTTTNVAVGTFNAVAVGTNATSPTSTDFKLWGQQGHKVIATTSIATATHGNVVLTANFAAGKITNSSNQNVAEAGIFDNSAANPNSNSTNLFARQTFSPISIGSSDTLQITWTVNIS
jgi:hypothetical protein